MLKHKKGLGIFLALALIAVIASIPVFSFLKKNGVILRSQHLIIIDEPEFQNRIKEAFEQRALEAQLRLSDILAKDFWANSPKSKYVLETGRTLSDLLAVIDRENPPKPIHIEVQEGEYDQPMLLRDGIILEGSNRDTSVFRADGIDYENWHSNVFIVPKGARCAFKNITVINTKRDYPSMAVNALDSSETVFYNCHLRSEGNDTLTVNTNTIVSLIGTVIEGNSDCLSTYGKTDIWNSYLDPTYRGDGARAIWLGGTANVYVENSILKSTNGIIEASAIGREELPKDPFQQQVSLVRCVAVRVPRYGRFFSIRSGLDGIFYRYHDDSSDAPALVHLKNTAWLRSEPGGENGSNFIHETDENKIYTPGK